MPVLAQEQSIWPENLFEAPTAPRTDECWSVLHVRPRSEKVVARQLLSRQCAFFLPLHERRKTYQRRLVVSYTPLFPSYLFVRANDDEVASISAIREVVSRLVPFSQLDLEHDLRRIHSLIQSGAPVTREQKLQPGMPARIVSGPLAGMSGHVVRNKNGIKFVLEVRFIQQGASVEVDGSLVEAL